MKTQLKINQYNFKTEGRLYHRNIGNERHVIRIADVCKSDDPKELKRSKEAVEARANKYIAYLDKASAPVKLEDMPKL